MKALEVVVGIGVLVSLLPLAGHAADGGAPPVALVAELHGDGNRVSEKGARPLRLFERLRVGDVLELGEESSAVVAYLSGRRYRVDAGARVTVVAEELKAERGVVHQLETVATVPAVARIPAAEYPGRRSGAIRIRSGSLWGAEVEGLYPRDGAGAFAEATVLTFRTLSNAASYRVDIEDEVGETVFAVETRSPEVVIPKGVLVPGTEYYWRVRTVGPRESGGRGEAVFVTLSADDVRARNRIRTAAESEGSANAVLLLAEVDRSLGLFREACRALDRAADQDTGNPHLTAAQDAFNCGEYGSSE